MTSDSGEPVIPLVPYVTKMAVMWHVGELTRALVLL